MMTFATMCRSAFIRAVLVGFACVASEASAMAACSRWTAKGSWQAVQSNGYKPNFELQHSGSDIQGSAWYPGPTSKACIARQTCRVIRGSVDGSLQGQQLTLNVYWDNGTVGIYTGTVDAQGRILGQTYDKVNPKSMATWYSSRTLRCEPDKIRIRRKPA